MTCGLYFCSASFGGFGVARIGAMVPESHLLFLCPPSCGRHTSLSSIVIGYRKKVSYLLIEEHEIAAGTAEDALYEGMEELLAQLSERPKAILVYICCSLYMSGLDETAVLYELSKRNPDITFQTCLMNPIAAGSGPAPSLTINSRIYGLLDTDGERNNTANLIGSSFPLDGGCELRSVLRDCGVEAINHISDTKTFEDFRALGKAGLNIILSPEGLLAAEELSEKMPYLFLPVSYDVETIKDQYEKLFDFLAARAKISEFERGAIEEIDSARETVGGRTIAISSSSTSSPYGLAKALINYGFNITSIFGSGTDGHDSESREWIRRNAAWVAEYDTEGADMLTKVGRCGSPDISIGFNAAYFTGSGAIVPLVGDEGMFGFHGIKKLMKMLKKSISDPKNLEEMMDEYGLVL